MNKISVQEIKIIKNFSVITGLIFFIISFISFWPCIFSVCSEDAVWFWGMITLPILQILEGVISRIFEPNQFVVNIGLFLSVFIEFAIVGLLLGVITIFVRRFIKNK